MDAGFQALIFNLCVAPSSWNSKVSLDFRKDREVRLTFEREVKIGVGEYGINSSWFLIDYKLRNYL